MQKGKVSKTKKLLYTIGEHTRGASVDLLDLLAALLDRRSFRQLAAGVSLDGVRATWSRRAAFEEKRLLARLEKQRWITLRYAVGRISVALTQKGRTIIRKEKIRCARTCPMNEGVLVTFDIPEDARHVRDAFRSFLKECGFQIVERSVWFSNRDVFEEIREFIRETKSQKWIHVFRVLNPAGRMINPKNSRS